MKITKFTTLTAALATAAIFSTGLSGTAMASESSGTERTAAVDTAVSSDEQQLIQTLSVIEAMPDGVVAQGDAAVQAYLKENLPAPAGVQAFGWMQKLKCGAAITAAIAGGAVPVAKILKLKAFISKVGSVKKAASLLIRVAKGEEKISELGATLGGLASVILGIDMIQKNCR
ncbi:hypothetical protein [Streptomyces sp. NPDC002994]|uniref:hypothetical protein n=1 Tax=Streptomyces sp. NPDC002994 TaxID=3154441 RepID=UPI0033B8C23C